MTGVYVRTRGKASKHSTWQKEFNFLHQAGVDPATRINFRSDQAATS